MSNSATARNAQPSTMERIERTVSCTPWPVKKTSAATMTAKISIIEWAARKVGAEIVS